ncbi:hypothetical protein LAZ67_13002616 [Cordylochernes scorpioides]|uniref:Transposase Tc1-like domain-containing protein n=1 Tax=Cordylochernes scorpioides TaxID=51811 RepID=A0ABY6L6N0_9ARAC|nr:hypothetical protein LAZ67_13002616 [Cordylochernes scorpioides]
MVPVAAFVLLFVTQGAVGMTVQELLGYFKNCDINKIKSLESGWSNVNPEGDWQDDLSKEILTQHCKQRVESGRELINILQSCLTDEMKEGIPEFENNAVTMMEQMCNNDTLMEGYVMFSLWSNAWLCYDQSLQEPHRESGRGTINHFDFFYDWFLKQMCGPEPLSEVCGSVSHNLASKGDLLIRVRQRKDSGLLRLWIIFQGKSVVVLDETNRWMQEGTTDRSVRLHPPQCTTSRAERQIVRMAVTDRSVTSQTVAQHIQSVTHYPVSARSIRRRSQQCGLSARRPLLRLLLTHSHRRLHRQWCDERRMWTAEWNAIVFTDESRFCLQNQDGRIRVWRHRGETMLNSCVMHRHTGPATGIMIWSGIGYHSRTPLVRIAGTLNSQRYISEVLEPVVLPYLQGLPTAILLRRFSAVDVCVQGF